MGEILRVGVAIRRTSEKLALVSRAQGAGSASGLATRMDRGNTNAARDDASNRSSEGLAQSQLNNVAGLTLATEIEALKTSIDRFGRYQEASPTRMSLSAASKAAERPRSVSGIEKGIAAGEGLNQNASIIRTMQRAGIVTAGRSPGSKDQEGDARIGAQSRMQGAMARGTNRVVEASHLLGAVSVKRAMRVGVWPNPETERNVRNARSESDDRSGRRFAGGDFGDQQALFDAAAAIAARSDAVAPRQIHRPEFAEPAKARQTRNSGELSAGISIQSSPTVIIHSGEDRKDIERQVASALRKHREQLFDEMKQEAGRRERAEY